MRCGDQLQWWYLSLTGLVCIASSFGSRAGAGPAIRNGDAGGPSKTNYKPTGELRTVLEVRGTSAFSSTWYHSLFLRSHPSNLRLPEVFFKARVEVGPPFKEHRLADQLEPRCKLERLVLEHSFQLLRADEDAVTNFVRVDVKVDVSFNKENVVDCMTLVLF